MRFELFVALRYLLAPRKQAFISVISLISVLGVAVGVAAVVIALALMTGLQGELRDRILGSQSHIFVYKGDGGFDHYEDDVQKLRAYLAARRLGDVPVYGVIVFATPGAQVTTREPVVPVSTLPALIASLGDNYLAKDRIDAAKVTGVVRLLYED